jgi:hypothetical protein
MKNVLPLNNQQVKQVIVIVKSVQKDQKLERKNKLQLIPHPIKKQHYQQSK